MTNVVQIQYTTKNTNFDKIIDIFKAGGFEYFCIFGGSIRDSDLKQKNDSAIKDYDIRIWSDKTDDVVCSSILSQLSLSEYKKVKCEGTDYYRYIFVYDEIEFDISIRQIPTCTITIEDCAKERAMNSDIGLSAIAISPSKKCWVHPQYIYDRDNGTLTLIKEQSIRTSAYMKRMLLKFPYCKMSL